MTLNGVMAVILRYFSEFGYLPGVLRRSSRSLSHLLMSSCNTRVVTLIRLCTAPRWGPIVETLAGTMCIGLCVCVCVCVCALRNLGTT